MALLGLIDVSQYICTAVVAIRKPDLDSQTQYLSWSLVPCTLIQERVPEGAVPLQT